MPRNYRNEYDSYQGTEEQKRRRANRNKDRREAEREGKVHKGDGKDIDHLNYNPKDHSSKNKRVVDKSTNRSKNKHKKGEKQNRS